MSGLFLSYSRADRALAEQIIRGLRAVGVAVWWDEDMRAVDWQQELEHRIHELAGVMVIWTEHSVNSDHVRDEARLGLETQKLVNVLDGVSKPPFPYDRINGLPLAGWTGREPHRGWTRLVGTVEEMVVQAGYARPGDITVALAMREQEMRQKGEAIILAQEALALAQGREVEAADAANATVAALRDMEEQLQRVAEMRPTAAILRAAQEEFYAVSAARDEAEQAKKAAKTATEAASHEIARAKADLDAMLTAPVDAPILPDRKGPPPRPRREPLAERMEPPPAEPPPPPPVEPPPVEPPSAPSTTAKPRKARAGPPAPPPIVEASTPVAATPAPTVTARPVSAPTPADWLGRQFASPTRRWLAISAAVGTVFILAVVTLSHHPPMSATPAAASVASSSGNSLSPADAAPALALVGKWAPQGLTCDDAYTLSLNGDRLSVALPGSLLVATVTPGGAVGTVAAHADNGDAYTYTLRRRTLTMDGPKGLSVKMTKCAG